MAIGDDALAAGMTILDGSEQADDIDLYINETRDYLAQRTYPVQPVANGGTGATDAAGALSNLGAASAADLSSKANATHYHAFLNGPAGRSFGWESVQWRTDDQVGIDNNLFVGSGHIYAVAAVAADTSPVAAYINVDGRICRGVSSRRYKQNITDIDVTGLDLFAVPLREFEMKTGSGERIVGYIAEELDDNPDTKRFVVRREGEVEAVSDTQLLMAQVAQLAARVAELEARE